MNNALFKIFLFTILAFAQITGSRAQVKAVQSFGITVKEINRSINFYSEVLGFRKISEEEVFGEAYEQLQGLFGIRMKIVTMQLGDEKIVLTDYLTTGGRSIPEDAKSNDLIFQHIAIVVSDMNKAYDHLRKYNITHVSTGPQTIPVTNHAAAGIKAFYFHDPDGHNLELIYFPQGKGLDKWQHNKDLFIGIDHSAIAVSDTEKSREFYESILGIPAKGESHNTGSEQSHLNFVEDATVHITGLRAEQGPGIEFLQYIQPGPGKEYPSDSKTDDLWHWQTTLLVSDVSSLYNQLKKQGKHFISANLVKFSTGRSAFIVRDPDGHALLIHD